MGGIRHIHSYLKTKTFSILVVFGISTYCILVSVEIILPLPLPLNINKAQFSFPPKKVKKP